MADNVKFQIKRGLSKDLQNAERIQGCWYLTTDTNEVFICNYADSLSPLISGGVKLYSSVSELPYPGNETIVYFTIEENNLEAYSWSVSSNNYFKVYKNSISVEDVKIEIDNALEEAKKYADEHDSDTLYDDTELRQLLTYIENELDSVKTTLTAVSQSANAALDLSTTFEASLADLTAQSDDLCERLTRVENSGYEKNIINEVSKEFNIDPESRKLEINSVPLSKVEGIDAIITSLQQNKVDRVYSLYEGKSVEWTLLSPENQQKLSSLVFDDGQIAISSKVTADNVEGLSAFITQNRDSIEGLLSITDKTKLDSSIHAVYIGGRNIASDGSADIPIATNTSYGVVVGDTSENKVSVNEDGTLEVNSLNINKLVQDEGDTLILNSGTSTV